MLRVQLLEHKWLVSNQSNVHLGQAMSHLKTFNAKRKLRVRRAVKGAR